MVGIRIRWVGVALSSCAAALIILLATSQLLGGPVRVVTTVGTSMEPALSSGDLVLLRRGRYIVGDVVAYKSSSLNRLVLHRVVSTARPGLVLKGDSNPKADRERPTASEILGKQVIRVPAAGKVMAIARGPIGLSIAAGMTLTFLLLGAPRARRR